MIKKYIYYKEKFYVENWEWKYYYLNVKNFLIFNNKKNGNHNLF